MSEFAFPNGFAITAPWRKIFRNLAIVVATAFVFGILSPGLRVWVLGLGVGVTVCQSLFQVLGTGRAFETNDSGGVTIPSHAVYPIGFRELARLLFKCAFFQFFLLIPFIAICAVSIAYLARWPLLDGAILGIEAVFLLLASRFITVTIAFSSATNDTARFRIRTLVLLATMVSLALGFLGLGAAALFIPAIAAGSGPMELVGFGLLALAILDAYVFYRVYGWFYHANCFDLMRVAQ